MEELQQEARQEKMRLEDMPEYQDKLFQSVIQACRKAGQSDKEILSWLEEL